MSEKGPKLRQEGCLSFRDEGQGMNSSLVMNVASSTHMSFTLFWSLEVWAAKISVNVIKMQCFCSQVSQVPKEGNNGMRASSLVPGSIAL